MTHAFHPLYGQRLEALVVLNRWGSDRVAYLGPDGFTRSLPVEWTDVVPADPVVSLAAGRALFRLTDLLALRAAVPGADTHTTSDADGGRTSC